MTRWRPLCTLYCTSLNLQKHQKLYAHWVIPMWGCILHSETCHMWPCDNLAIFTPQYHPKPYANRNSKPCMLRCRRHGSHDFVITPHRILQNLLQIKFSYPGWVHNTRVTNMLPHLHDQATSLQSPQKIIQNFNMQIWFITHFRFQFGTRVTYIISHLHDHQLDIFCTSFPITSKIIRNLNKQI